MLVALTSISARADQCPPDAATRLAFIEQGMGDAAHAAKVWAYSWGALWTTATVGQGVLAFVSPSHSDRVDFGVGAFASAVGLVPTLLFQPRIIADERALRTFHGNTCERLVQAETLLDDSVKNEQTNTGLLSHVGNVLFNVGVGMILGVGYGHWQAAGLSMATGIPTGEIMIFTQPRRTERLKVAFVPSERALELRVGLSL